MTKNKAGASVKMFPPLLCLIFLSGLLLCFPFGIFPLPVLALKERLYLREQDTGKGFYLVIGNSRTVVIELLSARHSITPLKLPLVEQVALEYRCTALLLCTLAEHFTQRIVVNHGLVVNRQQRLAHRFCHRVKARAFAGGLE